MAKPKAPEQLREPPEIPSSSFSFPPVVLSIQPKKLDRENLSRIHPAPGKTPFSVTVAAVPSWRVTAFCLPGFPPPSSYRSCLFPRRGAACATGTASRCRIRPAGSERSPEQQRCGHRKDGRRDHRNDQPPPGRRGAAWQILRIRLPSIQIPGQGTSGFPVFPVTVFFHASPPSAAVSGSYPRYPIA